MNDLFQIMVSILKPTIEIYLFEALIMDSYVLVLAASSGKNLDLAHRFSESFTEKGMETQIVDLTTLHWPVYTPELDGDPEREPDTAILSDLILNSEALVICAPEYNGSTPPIVNNAIAWISMSTKNWRDGFNKKVSLIASSSGGGGEKYFIAMKNQLEHLGSVVMPRGIKISSSNPLNEESAKKILKHFINLL